MEYTDRMVGTVSGGVRARIIGEEITFPRSLLTAY